MRTLVSGAASGLGAWLLRRLQAHRFDRSAVSDAVASGLHAPFDLIVHCASAMPTQGEALEAYESRLTLVCRSLLSVPHRKFVFISSVDAAVTPQRSAYAVVKRRIEEIVITSSSNTMILRPGALCGPGMRPSQLLKVARGDDAVLTLTPESRFSIVMYEDIVSAMEEAPPGTWHLMASRLVSLGEVAQRFQTRPQWGSYTYDTPDLPCDVPWRAIHPAIATDPLERLTAFLQRHD